MPSAMVSFSNVISFLEEHGYQLLRWRTDPNDRQVGLVVFSKPGFQLIGFPVRDKKVANAYYQEIRRIVLEAEGFGPGG